MRNSILIVVGWCVLMSTVQADPFIDRVVDIEYGAYAGFGQESLPDVILGPPHGAGLTGGSLHVLSLGDGGSITLEFVDNIPQNGPGADLIVFENAFFVGGDTGNAFAETAFVEVSQDGITFIRFPNDYNPDGQPVNHPRNWTGFAGVLPVLSNPENGIDPTDPAVAGGDPFDLDDVGLNWIRFVRIIDTGEPPNAAVDDNGDPIYDPASASEGNSGFDLDAVCAVHSEDIATPTPGAQYSATPTPSETSAPVPTATPSVTVLDLTLSGFHFVPNDLFLLQLEIFVPSTLPIEARQFVVLDISSLFYFWPAWTELPEYMDIMLETGVTTQDILAFKWPEIDGTMSGIRLWAAILDKDMNLIGNLDSVEFEY